MEDRFIPI